MKKYPLQTKPATPNSRDLHLAFDVGHSSIGWAVLQTPTNDVPQLLGCGAVIFQADDCLASQRRAFRRQRRHIRATRQRITRMKTLFAHLGVLTPAQLDHVTTSSPWLLAARVLASKGKEKLTWPQLWDVLRWYAHNRGYDGNQAWSHDSQDAAAEKEDNEKVQTALGLLNEFQKKHHRPGTMAEVWCELSGLDPLGPKTSTHLPDKQKRPKGQNAAFPRGCVRDEVLLILAAHDGHLPEVDEDLISALIYDWRDKPCPGLKLPARYGIANPNGELCLGGLLFGQFIPRFDNRIVATCPITFERHYQHLLAETGNAETAKHQAQKLAKVPTADCPEFHRYRWAMQLANIQIVTPGSGLRRLTSAERQALHQQIQVHGYFTKGEFKKAVRALTGGAPDNLDQMLLHPDADKALVLDPVQRLLTASEYAPLFAALPERLLKRYRGHLRRGHFYCFEELRSWFDTASEDPSAFDAALTAHLEAANTRRTKKTSPTTREQLLRSISRFEPPTGRAPHTRALMAEVFHFVLNNNTHPAEEGGPLYRSEAIRTAQLQRAIDEQTNNHLVRHRLKILDRLHADILREFSADDPSAVKKITIEVNRDLRELSGKTAQEVAKDQGQRLGNFKSVVKKLEAAFEGQNVRIGPGLIRKARIAEDLGWTCPYTGKSYDPFDLLHRRVDLDHIIPRSLRPSDSLDSLVVTFPEVNKLKGKRTAIQFVEEFQSQPAPGAANIHIKPLATFLKDIETLESFKGHDDDKRRKKNRKRLLQLRDYVEKEFTPGDLTKTSQLVRLGAQTLQKHYLGSGHPPVITSLPGSVTGTIRKSWRLLGCLSAANPAVTEETTKTEVRGITHLHHALDACTLAFGSHFLPRDGGVWELLIKHHLTELEQNHLLARGLLFQRDPQGRVSLTDLPPTLKNQIRQRLAERRVVQHIPAETRGLPAELNAWRVACVENGEALLRQRIRQPDGTRPLKERCEKNGKLLGLQPGKLHKLKAALVIADNYGLALDPEPTIIPFHKVRSQLHALRKYNGGKPPRVIRNGMLIHMPSGSRAGTWRVISVKNTQAYGLCFDLTSADGCQLQRGNAPIVKLLADGLQILPTKLTGHTTSPNKT